MKSANSDVATARNTHRAVFAAGRSDGPPASSCSATSPCHGCTLMVWRNSQSTITPINRERSTRPIVIALASCRRRRRLDPGFLRDLRGRNVLGDEVGPGPRHAVVVRPAIDDRQLLAEIAVLRWGFRGLPLQGGGIPRVA